MKNLAPLTPPILTTRLAPPPLTRRLVTRQRLLEQLGAGLNRKLILVSAPAGFGKSTLLAEWCSHLTMPNAWLTVDNLDNDVMRFLLHLAFAIEKMNPGFAAPFQAVLSSARPGTLVWLQSFLVQSLAGLAEKAVIILDDVHRAQSPEIYTLLEFLLEHLPEQITLVLSTREDPRIPLARLRAAGQLLELRAVDLQFLQEEAAQLVNAGRAAPISAPDLHILLERTEGWAAGLQMAEISLQAHPDPAAFIRDFSASNRYVMDFFLEEVWQRQPERVRSFLLATCVLDQLNASLCEHLSGDQHSQEMLEALESANLFIHPLDQERCWYRYHRLFAGLLQKHLADREPGRLAALHAQASGWYAACGESAPAIQHALLSADHNAAAHLILAQGEATLMQSHTFTLIHWIEALPPETLRRFPRLCVLLAWARLMTARPLTEILASLPTEDSYQEDRLAAGGAVGLKAMVASMQGKYADGLQLTTQAIALLGDEGNFYRSILMDNMGILNLLQGRFPQALEAFQEAVALGRKTGNILITVGALSNIASLELVQGRLNPAARLFEEALALSTSDDNRHLPIASKPIIGLGDILREQNDLEKAGALLKQGVELIRQYGEVGAILAHLSLARVALAKNDLLAADAAIRSAEDISARFDAATMDDRLVAACRALLQLIMGDIDRMLPWKEQMEQEAAHRAPGAWLTLLQADPVACMEMVTLAQVQLALGQPEKALHVLNRLSPREDVELHQRSQVKVRVLQAIAHHKLGQTAEAVRVFQHALAMGQPQGYARAFLDEGTAVLPLLENAAHQGEHSDYAWRLLKALQPASGKASAAGPLNERDRFTARELEVLTLIARGYTNQQIAHSLYLALDTVKGYTRRLYARLEAQNRSHAVQIARRMGLLPEED